MTMVTLGVGDIARAADFYERLGWVRKVARHKHTCFFQLNGMMLALYPRAALMDEGREERQIEKGFAGVSLLLSLCDDEAVDKIFQVAEQAGATILRRPAKVFWGGYSAYFSDPDGYMWEVNHNPFATLDEQDKSLAQTGMASNS
ncbi:MAG: VOC family protein [Stappiaceae bacterium]